MPRSPGVTTRRRLWKAQHGNCFDCGQPMLAQVVQSHPQAPTREHVYPKGGSGFGLLNNVVLTHNLCNNEKGCREPTADEIARARMLFHSMGLVFALRDDRPAPAEVSVPPGRARLADIWPTVPA